MLAAAIDFGFPRFAPAPAKAPEIARLLVERYGVNARPRKSESALEALLRRIRDARYDWDKIAPSDRLDVAWVLWEGVHPPAEHAAFLQGFLTWIETSHRRLQAGRVAAAWVAALDPTLPSIRTAGDWLARHVSWLPDPWPVLVARFDLFSIEKGPAALAEAFLGSDEATADFFKGLNIPSAGSGSGLALEMLAVATTCAAPWLAEEPRLAARLCMLAVDGKTFRPEATKLRTPHRARAIRRALAETLLSPWHHHSIPAETKAQLLPFLLHHYGDLRVTREQWTGISEPAETVMRRWLIERSTATYFRLSAQSKSIDRVRLIERAEFWMSNLDVIDDAWLLCSGRGMASLGTGQPAHGTLGGCAPDRSALLIRIGDLIILESSHEAHESVWFAGNPLAPPLHRRTDQPYWANALLKSPDFSSAFNQKDNHSWQERLARFIDRKCGRTIEV
jgi:hypothetical protein